MSDVENVHPHPNRLVHLQGNLPTSILELLQDIKAWGKQELEPYIPEHWDKATFPPHLFSSFRNRFPQLLGYTLPKQYGGAGFDLSTACQVSMTLASIDASFTTTLLVQYGLCAESILLCGTEPQRQRLLPSLARLDKMGCFCLTEPQSGSDASNLTTTAVRVPGGYHLTGCKRWIGNALTADVFVVWAKNTSQPGNPIMGFILECQHQPPGAIQTSKIHGKVSMRMLQNANVELFNAFCPDENVMGDHGKS
jgi:glutaryl-CoA dehydrogenase